MIKRLKRKWILLKISKAFETENSQRNTILVVTLASSIISLFLLLSTVNGRIKVDDIKCIRENGCLATAVLENVSKEQYQALEKLSYIEKTGIVRNFGVWYQENSKVATCCIVDNEKFKEMYLPAYDNVEGSYPQNINEIMLSLRILNSLGIEKPEVGMEIPVHIVLYNWLKNSSEDVDMMFLLSGYYTDYINDVEKLPKAFFSRELAKQQNFTFFIDDVLIKSDKLWMSSAQIEKQLYSDIKLQEEQNLIVINEGISKTIRSMLGNCIFALVGIILIVLSMNLFIYNIFSLSINKEIRNYGLLKVLGAEPRQIREIFIFSGLKIILQGCILGVLFGSLAVKLILPQLLEKMYLTEKGNINREEIFSGRLLIVSVVLCGAGVVGVLGSCIHTIMRLSPTECLKFEEKISISRKRNAYLKEAGILNIAWRNFARNKKKMLVTIGSLFIGIEIFLLSVMISAGLDQTNKIAQNPDFEVGITKEAVEYYLRLNEGNSLDDLKGHELMTDEIISHIIKMTGINSENIMKCIGGFGTFSHQSEAIKPRLDSWQYDSEIITGLTVQVVTEEWLDNLEAYVEKKEYTTDIDTLKEKNGFLLLHDHELSAKQLEEANAVIGEELTGVLFEEQSKAFKLICCGYLDISENGFPQLNMPWEGKNINYIIISEKTMEALSMKPVIYNISFNVSQKEEVRIKNILQNILQNANQSSEMNESYYLISNSDRLAEEQNYITAIRIIMGGFSGILMLFAFVSYYNTLLTDFISRSREIIIMRKIGMTVKQLKVMLVSEGIFYSIFTVALLLTLGSGILLLTGEMIHHQVSYFVFHYPWVCTFIAFAVMFLVSAFLPVVLYSNSAKKLS